MVTGITTVAVQKGEKKYYYERDNSEIRLTQFVRKRHSRVLTCDEE